MPRRVISAVGELTKRVLIFLVNHSRPIPVTVPETVS